MKRKIVFPCDGGLVKNLPPYLIDDSAFSDGNNIMFSKGYMGKVGGWKKFSANKLDTTVYQIDNFYKFNGDAWFILCSTDKVYKYHDDLDTFEQIGAIVGGSLEHPLFTENVNDYFVMTNGIDKVKYWDGQLASMAELPGLTDCEGGVTSILAKTLLSYKNFLILGGTTENGTSCPQRIRWSQIGNCTKWKNNSDGTGQAGYADLAEGVDWVQCMRPLGDYIVIYKERSIQVLAYVGGDTIFERRPTIMGTGLLAPKAIIDLGNEHLFVGPDNIYSYDLVEVKVAGDDIKQDFFRILDPSKTSLINSFFIEETSEAWFSFVSINSSDGFPDKCLVYNIDTKKWSIRDMPFTAFGFYRANSDKNIDDIDLPIDSIDQEFDSSYYFSNAPINIVGDKDGNLFILDGHSKDDGDIHGFGVTKLTDLGDPSIIKRLMRIQLMVQREGNYNLMVSVGTAKSPDEYISWNGPYTLKLDEMNPPWIDVDLSARYFTLKFETFHKYEPFKIYGYIFNYNTRGEF